LRRCSALGRWRFGFGRNALVFDWYEGVACSPALTASVDGVPEFRLGVLGLRFGLRSNDGLRKSISVGFLPRCLHRLCLRNVLYVLRAERSLRRPPYASVYVHDALARRWIRMDREHQKGVLAPGGGGFGSHCLLRHISHVSRLACARVAVFFGTQRGADPTA
jgi:hypothetical protein